VGADAQQTWQNRGHFFAAAAEAMRRILVENARKKRSAKHGGGLGRQDLAEVSISEPELGDELLALDSALAQLATKDPVKARLVNLRYFAGLTIEETAHTLGISVTTANRYWAYARAWLHQAIITDSPETGNTARVEKKCS
jgi:RNA polymerase sigma factor (TIGR02999 family)